MLLQFFSAYLNVAMNKSGMHCWTEKNALRLIHEYRSHRCLWDPEDSFYRSTTDKNLAWELIAGVFNLDQVEVRRKMNSLLASFRREKSREKNKQIAGIPYRSRWFAYKALSFLFFKNGGHGDNENAEGNNYLEFSEDFSDEETDRLEDIKFECVDAEISDVDIDDIKQDMFETLPSSNVTDPVPVNETTSYQQAQKKRKKDEPSSNVVNPSTSKSEKSATDFFGEYIISKMKKYNETVRNVIQHKISQILFEADMGEFDKQTSQAKSSQDASNDSQHDVHKE